MTSKAFSQKALALILASASLSTATAGDEPVDRNLRLSMTLTAPPTIAAADSLTLPSALILHALQRSSEAMSGMADQNAAEARTDKARGALWPSLTANAYQSLTRDSETRSTQKDLSGNFVLRLPLFQASSWMDLSLAQSGFDESRLARQEILADLADRIFTSYIGLLNTREEIRVYEHELSLLAEQRGINQRRLQGGVGTVTEVTESTLREQIVRKDLDTLRRDLETQRLELRQLVQDADADTGTLRETPLDMAIDIPGHDEAALEMARHNPTLARTTQAVVTAKTGVRRQTAMHLPTVELVGESGTLKSRIDGQTSVDNQRTHQLTLQVGVPLFAGGTVTAAERESRALVDKAEYDLQTVTIRLQTSLRSAYNDIGKYDEQRRLVEATLDTANAVADQTRRSFLAGYRTNNDLINAQRQVSEIRRDLNKARTGKLLAQFKAMLLTGKLDEALLHDLDRFVIPGK